ncbi:SPASM domain-containing protein [candidate division CSSED10-310 bacterium]|uniref:SPASM domain-containing protein n=1 Tax=candidate division CSSED10-310 bacterium TaxID=2855610 RepID=A0ABV6YXY4_UNCC1
MAFDTYRDWQEFTSLALSPPQIQSLCQDLMRVREHLESISLDHNIDDVLIKYKLGEDAWRQAACYIGWFFTRILVDGTVVPCPPCAVSMGNLTENSLEEIWNGADYLNFRRKTLVPGGSKSYSDWCDCNWCHHVKDNYRVYRFLKWIAPNVVK